VKTAKAGQIEPGPGKRAIVLEALVAGESQDAAAQLAGVSRRSVVRWLAEPGFADELTRARVAAFAEALSALKGGACLAVQTLLDGLKSRSPAERRQAATRILEFSFRGVELQDFEQRLAVLEAYIEERHPGRGRIS